MLGRTAVVALAVGLLLLPACGDDDDTASTATDGSSDTVVLQDPFDDDANDWGPGGTRDPTTTKHVVDGNLELRVRRTLNPDPDLVYPPALLWAQAIEARAPDLGDQRVETSVRFTEPGVAGLACRITDPGSSGRAYYFEFGSSGVALIAEGQPDDTVEVLEGNPTEQGGDPPVDFDPDHTYDLAAECTDGEQGVHLSFTVDGEELVATDDEDDPIDRGLGGVLLGQSGILTAEQGFSPFRIAYDSFTLSTPPP